MIKNVAAVVSGMDEEYPYHIITGINEYAREHDINVSYFASGKLLFSHLIYSFKKAAPSFMI